MTAIPHRISPISTQSERNTNDQLALLLHGQNTTQMIHWPY